ncbi:MAG: hypothetical protein HC915_18150, partial [Anaerolineae bacterium]|nr:hypothetical protein [Anaerolineae bacterium]
QIPGGAQVRVLAGPTCASGFVYWQVEYNGMVGWTAEGDATTYFMVPQSSPLQNYTDDRCPGAPETSFQVGDAVQVDFNAGGRLQITGSPEGAINAADILARVGDNTRLLILGGPVCGYNGNTWRWLVRDLETSIEGWASEGVPGDAYLCPLANPECGS